MASLDIGKPDDTEREPRSGLPTFVYLLLLVPIALFVISLYLRPTMYSDSGYGFLVLRGMLAGAGFNNAIMPDPANIAHDITAFQGWWSPGQYLAPGFFIWLGADYGLALCLTVLFATVIGVIGWAQVARSFGVSGFVLFVFLSGLVTFRYATLPFRIYNGGEVLLFAAAPWGLYWQRKAIEKPPLACFALTLLAAAVLFFAKLTGLIAFAANVTAIGLFAVLRHRRLTASMLAMAAATAVAAILFLEFWVRRAAVPELGAEFSINWPAFLFPASAAAFSGVSGLDLLSWIFLRPSAPILSDITTTSYVAGPLGLLLMIFTWRRLRNTPYRPMAAFLFTVIALYAMALATYYLRGATISYEERHFRYGGILVLLLVLVALDQGPRSVGRKLALVGVTAFAAYGLASYASGARDLITSRSYDPQSGTSQEIVPPTALAYLRSEMTGHNWQRAIAVIPSPEAAIGLPRYRIIAVHLDFTSLQDLAGKSWAGRAEKIFVIVQDRMTENGKADALLKAFVDYDRDKWNEVRIDGMTVYSQ